MKERDKFYFKLALPALILTFFVFLLPLFSVLMRAFQKGPEAVLELEVKDFPTICIIDSRGEVFKPEAI